MNSPQAQLYRGAGFAEVRSGLMARKADRPERLAEAYFERESPPMMLWEDVEAIWSRIDEEDNWSDFHRKLADIEDQRRIFGVQSPSN